ncbi:hypothetical protein AX15_000608 [Amanita polypyramis BW_CC]|nr:hypothetical protein AX15_000608 [Amanita polypyramis BW_CC]
MPVEGNLEKYDSNGDHPTSVLFCAIYRSRFELRLNGFISLGVTFLVVFSIITQVVTLPPMTGAISSVIFGTKEREKLYGNSYFPLAASFDKGNHDSAITVRHVQPRRECDRGADVQVSIEGYPVTIYGLVTTNALFCQRADEAESTWLIPRWCDIQIKYVV